MNCGKEDEKTMTAKTTDKELLELAAKAAGIDYDPDKSKPHPVSGAFWGLWLRIKGEPYEGQRRYWSPLTDDGAALRLAVALRLKIIPGKHPGDGCTVEAQRSGIAGCTSFQDDKHEQMRYAIIRVAAEIGKAMP